MKAVYRIVTALTGLGVFACAIFLPLFRLRIGVTLLKTDIQEDFSIYSLYNYLKPNGSLDGLITGEGNFLNNPYVKHLMPAAVTFAAFFAAALLLALIVVFFAALSNQKLVIGILSAAGVACLIGSYIAFGRLASPLLDGSISLPELLNLGFISSTLVGAAVKLVLLRLTSATFFMILCFAGIILWTLAFVLTEDDKEKLQRANEKAAKKAVKSSKRLNRARG